MNSKENSYLKELQRCRDNIANTKRLIEYHKDMLKKMERKEAEVKAKLDSVKLLDLRELISKGGYDIDTLREAMKAGDFSGVAAQNVDDDSAEPAKNISQQEKAESSADENETSDTDEENLDIERKDEK